MDGLMRFGCLGRCLIAFLALVVWSQPASASAASRSPLAGGREGRSLQRNAKAATALAPGDNLVVNPIARRSYDGLAGCYAVAVVTGDAARFTRSPRGSNGSALLTIGRYRRPLMLTQSAACAPKVVVGHAYTASLRYRSTTRASFEVLAHSQTGWRVWYVAATRLKATRSLRKLSVLLRPIQGGVDQVVFGLLLRSRGSLQSTDFSLIDSSAAPGAPSPLFNGSQGFVTPLLGPSLSTPKTEEMPSGEKGPPAKEIPPDEETPPVKGGKWTVIAGVDKARSVHAILLQDGKLLIMAGSGNDRMEFEEGKFKSYLYNPVAGTWKELETPKDVFCSGHVQLADGNVLILGGTRAYPDPPKPGEYPSTIYKGENMSWIFNIRSERYEQVPYAEAKPSNPNEPGPLLSGTWYPSATELGNGDVISFGGLNEKGEGTTDTNYFTDPANEGTNGDQSGQWVGWASTKLQQTYPWFWGLYPSMILTADGRLFYDGSHVFGNGLEGTPQAPSGSSLYDFYCTPGKTSLQEEEERDHPNPNAEVEGPKGVVFKRVTDTPGLREPNMRDQSASLLLPPAQNQKVMIMGGGNTYEPMKNAIGFTEEIDLKETSPHWIAGPSLPSGSMEDGSMEPAGAGKMYISAVALPDGGVLETGGSLHPRTENVREASIFDPSTNAFTPVVADPVGRDYHSEALLLPDGRVIALGSNPANPVTGAESFETRISIYEPPYLFKGSRPALQLIDGEANHLEAGVNKTKQWEYGTEHTLGYSSSSPVTKAVLIRPAAVTHSSDPNQREVALPISHDENGELTVSLTSNDNIAPPGYYMVFLVNSSGVPSVAQWVHVGAQGAPAP
jgi:galactose oxidase-like protein